jgi:hypothetical protein
MKPSSQLLRPALTSAASKTSKTTKSAKSPVPERELLVLRKQATQQDVQKLEAAAKGELDQKLEALIEGLRRDTSGRPPAVPGAVTIRILGSSCKDASPVPLPKLRDTLETAAGASASALTDVTGFCLLMPQTAEATKEEPVKEEPAKAEPTKSEAAAPAPAAATGASPTLDATRVAKPGEAFAYRLRVAASDGKPVAELDADPTRTHLLHLGQSDALEGHAALGRGWLAKLDEVTAKRRDVAQAASARLKEHLSRAQSRLAAIDRRLDLQGKKA